MMDRGDWDERYDEEGLLWTARPNRFLVEQIGGLAPGRALDVACGEGRNAVWLATQGWEARGIDFSAVGLAKAQTLAAEAGVQVDWIEADVLDCELESEHYDLITILYLQLPGAERTAVHRKYVAGLAPDGLLLIIAHDLENLTHGYGGPKEASVLFTPADVVDDLSGLGLAIEVAERVARPVATDGGERTAIDLLVRARRPA
jgi:SAM-dependent methyltransferase